MAKKKKLDFRPDPTGTGLLNKLYITPTQRKKIYRWTLYSILCVALLVVQDVILSRLRLYGGSVDIAPCAIILVCVMEGAESGGVFALAASIFYLYSGSAPGAYCVALITLPAILAAIFRQNFLRRGFGSHWMCTAMAATVYQMGVFAVGLFMGYTYPQRVLSFVINGALALAALPVVYPIFGVISKIGGETWKE